MVGQGVRHGRLARLSHGKVLVQRDAAQAEHGERVLVTLCNREAREHSVGL